MSKFSSLPMVDFRQARASRIVDIKEVSSRALIVLDTGETVVEDKKWAEKNKPEVGGYYLSFDDRGFLTCCLSAEAYKVSVIGNAALDAEVAEKRLFAKIIVVRAEPMTRGEFGPVPDGPLSDRPGEPGYKVSDGVSEGWESAASFEKNARHLDSHDAMVAMEKGRGFEFFGGN